MDQSAEDQGGKKRKLGDGDGGGAAVAQDDSGGSADLSGLVDAGDVSLVVAQHLVELNCLKTLTCLQEELGMRFNVMDGKSELLQGVKDVKFDAVLQRLDESRVTLRKETFSLLHELVVLDLCEKGEHEAAKKIFIASDALQHLKETHQPRYKLLVKAIQRKATVKVKAERSGQIEALVEILDEELIEAKPGQLLRLVGDAIKWKKLKGSWPHKAGLVGRYANRVEEARRSDTKGDGAETGAQDEIIQTPYASIRFGKQAHAETCEFSPDGRYIASGSTDGFIELWDPKTGKLSLDLAYQKADELMMHSKSILCLRFSRDSTLLATGCKKGLVKLWRISDGTCLMKFKRVHKEGVLSLDISRTNDAVISGGADHSLKLLGVNSANVLREFSGHTSYVNSIRFYDDDSMILSASSDGTVRVWQANTGTCVKVVSNLGSGHLENFAVTKIVVLDKDNILLGRRSESLVMLGADFSIKQRYSVKDAQFITVGATLDSSLLYGGTATGQIHCFDKITGQRKATSTIDHAAQKEILDIDIHTSGAALAAVTIAGPVVLLR